VITDKKKVAIFVDTRKESGGEYQHFLYTLDNIKKNNKDNIDFIVISISKKLNLNLEKEDINYFFFSMNLFERFICYLRNFGPFVRRVKKFFFFKNKFEKFLEKLNVDLVYFTSPSQYSLYLENTKFIISVPDVDHLIYLEFPEFVNNSEFFRRDEILRKSLPRAQAILTNAEIIKKKISKFYSVEENRIYIISLRPCRSVEEFKKIDKDYMLEIEKKFNLPKKYLFYPAMYLPHKNHKSLVDALKILKFDYNLDINIVCTGSDVGYLSEIKEYSIKNKVNNNIFFLDFVDNKALPYLYLNSIALIFPVLAGPTFTPPWEAFKMGVPVIFSNLLGVKNVYKDAVYYIDPLDSYSIANSVIILLENNSIRENLITRGREILKELNDKNEYGQLFFIIKHYRKINQTWNFEKP
jgi:glycosyltransferase involved in cell wall biosynthesis